MKLLISDESVHFFVGTALAGRYNLNDSFKPFIHPLNTPTGRTVSCASPHDHKHHKGLMYALRTAEVNFWEEVSTQPGEQVGRQRPQGFTTVAESGEEVGFTEQLCWEAVESTVPIFLEERTIRWRQHNAAIVWTWNTRLTAQRDLRLIKSQWSWPLSDGRKINYHGLGLRFTRSFGATGNNALTLDDKTVNFKDGMGAAPRQACFTGSFDPVWPELPGAKASVTFTQRQRNGLFVLDAPFAFMSLGPSNLEELVISPGQVLEERYEITVADVPG